MLCILFLRPIQNFEPITLEHFFSAPALERERFASAVRNHCAARGIIALVTASEDCLAYQSAIRNARDRARFGVIVLTASTGSIVFERRGALCMTI